MTGTVEGWLLAAGVYCIFLATLPVTIRLFGGGRRHVEAVIGTALGLFVAALALLCQNLDRSALWGFAALYGFLFIVFLQAFAVLYKSISLRMLVEIAALPTQSLPVHDVHEALVVRGAFARRLSGLEENGHLRRTGDNMCLTDKGRVIAGRIVATQRFFGIETSG